MTTARRRTPSALRHGLAQAGHRRHQRRVRGHRAHPGADVRRPVRRGRRQVHHRVRPARADRRVRHLVDPAARRRLERRARPAAERPHLLRRGGQGTRPGQGRRAARRVDAARAGLRRGHGRALRAERAGGDQAAALRRRIAKRPRHQRRSGETDARVDAAARLHRRHHRLLREETAELSAIDTGAWRTRHAATGLPGDRRRQPLLRDDRLVHPPPAQGVQASRRADAHRGQAHVRRHGRVWSTTSSRTRRSIRSSSRAAWICCSAARSPRAWIRRR